MVPPVQPGSLLAGVYEVERLLGEGGMGVVVAARHRELGRTVALKCMLPMALSFPQAMQRFVREAKVLALLESEHLAKVIDAGMLESGAPYFAMEYLDGLDLGKVIRQYGALAVADAAELVRQACVGMAVAHERGVVHRDLKPSNLLLSQRADGAALIKVLDFGLSKLVDTDIDEQLGTTLTQTTGTMGTPAYMSPEQARSARSADVRSDVWSLGAILYYLLSARLPFPAQATAEAFAKVLYEEPAPLRESAPWVPAELEDVVLRCLQKDPQRRYQQVDELAADLAPFVREPDAQSKAVHHGPHRLDIAAVLQQRTMAMMEPMSLELAGTLMQQPIVLPAPPAPAPPVTSRRGGIALLALGGGVLVACGVLVGALLFSGSGTTTTRSAQAQPALDAGADLPPTADAGPIEAADAGPGAGADHGGGLVIDSPAAAGAPLVRPRPRPAPTKKPAPTPAELDPFGTIH